MYTIYEDDYAQTAFPRDESNGAVELYWDHRKFPKQWSSRFCDNFPYDEWTDVSPLSKTSGSYGSWSLINIIMLHFGLYQKRTGITWAELLTMSPALLKELSQQDQLPDIYRKSDFKKSCQILILTFEQVSLELIDYFSHHPEEFHHLDWRKFELVLDVIFKNLGFETEVGPGSGDCGVDLRLINKDPFGPVLTLVQAKKRATKYPVKLDAVAALHGIVEEEGANSGLFVTTSQFLPSAKRFAAAKSYKLLLAEPNDIAKWCREISK